MAIAWGILLQKSICSVFGMNSGRNGEFALGAGRQARTAYGPSANTKNYGNLKRPSHTVNEGVYDPFVKNDTNSPTAPYNMIT
jgi:hypothetical protein